MLPKTFIFFAVSCLTAASASGFDDLLHTGNGNYIIQLNQTTCIKDFVPKFIEGAFEIFSQNFGGADNFEKKGNRIVRRGTGADQVHVFDAYDIGNAFKGITVKFEKLEIVKDLISSFNGDILKIIPDENSKIDLPKGKKASLKKRYYIRSTDRPPAQPTRAGNFDINNYEHDENCPYKHDKNGNHAKRGAKNVKKTNKKIRARRINKNISSSATYVKQTGAEWNLVRVSQKKIDYTAPYIYDSNAGSDAYVYVVDDGMNIDHNDFEGRATWGFTAYTGISKLGGGHGTHVAGTIGSKTYGIAKKTNLIAVQVLDEEGSGTVSAFLAGLQWVTDHAKAHKGKCVINMSLGMQAGDGTSPAVKSFNEAVDAVVGAGVPVIAAAGNWDSDACDVVPAGNENVYAVGATDKADAMTSFSSYGTCVQTNAPGNNIKSLSIDSNTATEIMSGTSMASPHVAGVAALIIGQISDSTPVKLYKELTAIGTKSVVTNLKSGTPNLLLFNGQQSTTE